MWQTEKKAWWAGAALATAASCAVSVREAPCLCQERLARLGSLGLPTPTLRPTAPPALHAVSRLPSLLGLSCPWLYLFLSLSPSCSGCLPLSFSRSFFFSGTNEAQVNGSLPPRRWGIPDTETPRWTRLRDHLVQQSGQPRPESCPDHSAGGGGGAVRQASHPLTQERATVEPLGLGPFSQAPTTAILLACRRGRSPRAKDSA